MAPSVFNGALGLVELDPSGLCFVDLGCGKGRTLILAARRGFKRVIGVEFSPGLVAIARKNLKRTGLDAEVVDEDAGQYRLPDDNLVIYMYNPFGSAVMITVIRSLLEWGKSCRRTAYVIYLEDIHHGLFESEAAFELIARRDHLSVWRLRDGGRSAQMS
ncbi:MAG: class I SAM-dependent methyltransferase [Candidatus Acidiferrales bacterium]